MKAVAYFVVFLVMLLAGCKTIGDKRLVGKWELVEFALVGQGGNPVSNAETLRNAGAVWDLEFSKNGDFSQKFNMRKRSMEMETEEGTWKTEQDSLLIELQKDVVASKLDYTYKFKEDTLVLTLAPRESKSKIITKFVEK